MKQLKKRPAAALVLVLSMVLSVFVGGGWKLRQARAEAEDAFFNGKAGFAVYNDLMELREISYNMLRISESAGDAQAEQRTAASAWARLDEAKTPEEYASACRGLTEAVSALDAAFAPGDDAVRESWERQMTSFSEYTSHLRFDSYYDEKAEEYNRLLDDPLAAMLGTLTGSGEMPRFTDPG